MKKALVLVFASLLVTVGCGAAKQVGSTSQPVSVELLGAWKITTTTTAPSDASNMSIFLATLVTSSCAMNTPVGTATSDGIGPPCFIADNNTEQGSVSDDGGQPGFQGVLIGARQDPAPAGSTVQFVFVQVDQSGNVTVIDATAVVGAAGNGDASTQLSGRWVCDLSSPFCQGTSGTWYGVKQ